MATVDAVLRDRKQAFQWVLNRARHTPRGGVDDTRLAARAAAPRLQGMLGATVTEREQAPFFVQALECVQGTSGKTQT